MKSSSQDPTVMELTSSCSCCTADNLIEVFMVPCLTSMTQCRVTPFPVSSPQPLPHFRSPRHKTRSTDARYAVQLMRGRFLRTDVEWIGRHLGAKMAMDV